MFKFSLKLCFISLVLLFNIPNFSLLIAQEGDTADSQEVEPEVQGDVSPIDPEEDTTELEDESALESIAEGDAAEEEVVQAQKEKTEEASIGEAGVEELKQVEMVGVVEEPEEQEPDKPTEPEVEKKTIEVKSETELDDKSIETTQAQPSSEPAEQEPEKPTEPEVEKKTTEVKVEKKATEVKSETESDDKSIETAQAQPSSEPEESDQIQPESAQAPVEQTAQPVQTKGPEGLDKIELQEQGAPLVKTDDAGKKLKEVLKQAKAIGKDINNITDKLREIRNKLHAKYQKDVDKNLDELLQKMGFESGVATGKERFKLLHRAVKSEYEKEWGKIKTEVNEIDSLENQVFEKLKALDDKYENAVQISIESRKLNLEVFNVSEVSKIEDVLKKLQTKQQDIKKVEEEITKTIEKEFDLLITQIAEKFKNVENDFKELEQKGKDLDVYEQALEKAREAKRNQLPKWRQVTENVVDRALDYSSMIIKKVKDFWNSSYLKISLFVKTFVGDVKEKSKEINKDNVESEDEKEKSK